MFYKINTVPILGVQTIDFVTFIKLSYTGPPKVSDVPS